MNDHIDLTQTFRREQIRRQRRDAWLDLLAVVGLILIYGLAAIVIGCLAAIAGRASIVIFLVTILILNWGWWSLHRLTNRRK